MILKNTTAKWRFIPILLLAGTMYMSYVKVYFLMVSGSRRRFVA